MTFADLACMINNAFPIFAYGERHIDEELNKFPFNQEGMKQQWDWYCRLWGNVLEFLDKEFPKKGKYWCSIFCDLQMCQLREKIESIENEFNCYRAIMLSQVSQAEFDNLQAL